MQRACMLLNDDCMHRAFLASAVGYWHSRKTLNLGGVSVPCKLQNQRVLIICSYLVTAFIHGQAAARFRCIANKGYDAEV